MFLFILLFGSLLLGGWLVWVLKKDREMDLEKEDILFFSFQPVETILHVPLFLVKFH